MEACVSVEKEVDKVLSKFGGLNEHTSQTLEDLVQHIADLRDSLAGGESSLELTPTQALILNQSVKKIKDTINQISTEHKDLHSTVSKVGKAIDRNFVSDFSSVVSESVLNAETHATILNEVVSEHFLRQGMMDIAEQLITDANLKIADDKKEPFLELHRILESLKRRNLEPALEWTELNKDRLAALNSSLEFKLHKLQFIELISQGPLRQRQALEHAHLLAKFSPSHNRELQVLMGSLLFLRNGIEHSPYRHLLDPGLWDEICEVFTRDACTLMGLSVESPLSVSVHAGCAALPPLLNIKQVMQQRQVSGVWNAKDELPVEIDLGHDCRYHSIFACPILRQQATDNNPPVRLVCGHVISKDALSKLSNGNKVKCPYCPVEQSPSDAKLIYL